jgi:integrase
MSTYDVRIWSIEEHKGKDRKTHKPKSTFRVRWVVAGQRFGDSFATRPLAESYRSRLLVAQREGVAFDESCGLPEPMARQLRASSWYQHAVEYVDMKWPHASPNHRRGIAETLADLTPVFLSGERGAPDDATLRTVLYGHVFNAGARAAGSTPSHVAAVIEWLEGNTVDLTALKDAALVRKALDTIALRRTDGKTAAAATIARKRAVFSNLLLYAVELGRLEVHPLSVVSWSPPKLPNGVDRNVVANPTQAAALLAAVAVDTPELEAYFGCLYYAGLRPEEALHLTEPEFERPITPDGWGWLHLSGAMAQPGRRWNDSGQATEDRGLKHRAVKTTRSVPVLPPLAALLTDHIERFPPAGNGRLFVTRRGPGGRLIEHPVGTPVPRNALSTAWKRARKKALTPAQIASPLARRPYDLRHACLSTWLNAGVPGPQVAEWAGNSVKVLLDFYAKCLDGGVEASLHRICLALGLPLKT